MPPPIVIFAPLTTKCRGSSVAEQGTHKPLVGSPNLPLGTKKDHHLYGGLFFIYPAHFDNLAKTAEAASKVYNSILMPCKLKSRN